MRRRALGLVTVVVAAAMDLLDGTVLNTVLPRIQRDLGAGGTATSWIATAYTLVLGIGLTVGGRLGDRFGHRRLLVVGVVGFALASLACALASDPTTLIAGRAAQGAASAVMVPQALALIQLLYPPEQRSRALSLFAAVAGLATVGGPLLGAAVTELDLSGWGWRAVFLLNLPLAVLVLLGTPALPRPAQRPTSGLDLPGAALLGSALLATLLPLLAAAEGGWTAAEVAGLILAVGLFAALTVLERRRSRRGRPVLVEPDLLRIPGLLGALAVSTAIYAAVFGLFFTLALFLQSGLGWNPLHAALTVLPWALGILLANTIGARRLVPRHGRRVLECGVLTLLTGLAALTVLVAVSGAALSTTVMVGPLLLAGIGMGLVIAPVLALGLEAVPPALAGGASGLITNTQQLAGALGIAVTAPIYFAGPDAELTPTLLTVIAITALAAPAARLLPPRAREQLGPRPGRR